MLLYTGNRLRKRVRKELNSILQTCQVHPYPHLKFRAVRLGLPNIQAQFKTVLKNATGAVIDSRVFNIDLTKGKTLV